MIHLACSEYLDFLIDLKTENLYYSTYRQTDGRLSKPRGSL